MLTRRQWVAAMELRRPEILAPAGSEESFAAALASGADAIYLGLAEGFNARARSTAFGLADLRQLARRAHAAGARLYLTFNTLVFERELPQLEAVLREVVQSGVDALIVQDPATAFLAKRLAPELRLHASTQMTISSAEGGSFAATLGIERVVLPRELSAREVALFCRESPLEAEVFVHGALCMSWSGQCLTSEAFSGRSANRGQCSQACRMPYEAVVDGRKQELGDVRYLLSPQDLAAHEVLPELMAAGVHSLKIEGRYKGAAYVTTAVDSWRNWRDALLAGPTSADRERLHADTLRTLLTYSRGGSVGFLRGDDHQRLVVGTTPKHRGVQLGSVTRVDDSSAWVRLDCEPTVRQLLRPGVGIVFELMGREAHEHDPEHAPGGPLFGLERAGELSILRFGRPGPDLSRVRQGDGVRLTGDPEIARDVARRLKQDAPGRLPLRLEVQGKSGEPLRLVGRVDVVGRSLSASVQTRTPLQTARAGVGLTREVLAEKLGALGGTPFHLAELDARELEAGLHVPVSELKQARRELTLALDAEFERHVRYQVPDGPCLPALQAELGSAVTADEGPPLLVPLCRTEEQLDAMIASLPRGTELELDWMEMVGLTRAVEKARAAGFAVTLATVRVQKPGEEAYDRRIAGLRPTGVLVRHWGALMHFSRSQREKPGTGTPELHGDFSLNVTNSLTAHHLLGLGLRTVTASHDLDRTQLVDLLESVARGRVAVTLHHHIPTFHDSHCVYAHLLSDGADYRTCGRPCEKHRLALRDYVGHEHPVVVDVGCRNTVFNAMAQSAAPLVPRLLELGVRRFRVEFVWESGEEAARVVSAYRRLLLGELGAAEALELASVHERYGVTTPLRTKGR